MTEPQGGTKETKIAKLKEKKAEEEVKYENYPVGGKMRQNCEAKIAGINDEIRTLQNMPDEIKLSDTCISKLKEIYIEQTYGRVKFLSNKYLEKGKEVEEQSIQLLRDLGIINEFHEKNTERKFGEFIEGEIDINCDDFIVDTKSTWDIHTFFKKEDEETNKIYYWQGQGYMILWGISEYKLCYCLVNTPVGLIEDAKNKLLYDLGTNMKDTEMYRQACEDLEKEMIFDDIDAPERLIMDEFKKEPVEEQLYKRLTDCRIWLNNYTRWRFISIYGEESYSEELHGFPKMISSLKPQVQIASSGVENISMTVDEAKELGTVVATKDEKVLVQTEIWKADIQVAPVLKSESIINTETVSGNTTISNNSEVNILKTTVEIPFPEVENAILFGSVEDRINSCQSKDECMALYKEIKDLFTDENNWKELLKQKKDSFDNETTPQTQKTVETVKITEDTTKTESKPVKIEQPEAKTSEPVVESDSVMEIRRLFLVIRDATDVDDIKRLYINNKMLIDTNRTVVSGETVTLRRYIDARIQSLKK
jgi:hypothetical protein